MQINNEQPKEAIETIKNPIDQLIIRLRRYNEWLRGAEIEQPEPVALGRDIDMAADLLESVMQALFAR